VHGPADRTKHLVEKVLAELHAGGADEILRQARS
jgi:hypothetical protein